MEIKAMSIKPCIVIPVYKEELTELENHSLSRLFSLMKRTQIIFAVKESIKDKVFKGSVKIGFPDYFFKDLVTYSQLLNGSMFWSKFSEYSHMLLHQMDCWLYGNDDELEFWCKMGYGMIGSPHFKGFDWEKNPNELMQNSMNGGFSLRDVKAHYELATHLEQTIPNFKNIETHEDVHWCNVLKHFGYRMPDPLTAARFGWEHGAKTLYPAIGENLPFGTHNPFKYCLHYPEHLRDFYTSSSILGEL
jgi:hypothetical protein